MNIHNYNLPSTTPREKTPPKLSTTKLFNRSDLISQFSSNYSPRKTNNDKARRANLKLDEKQIVVIKMCQQCEIKKQQRTTKIIYIFSSFFFFVYCWKSLIKIMQKFLHVTPYDDVEKLSIPFSKPLNINPGLFRTPHMTPVHEP